MTRNVEIQRKALRDRLKERRAKPAMPPGRISRINDLTRTARGIWFGLLGYMAFVGVTLMGVRDVDFFLTDNRTSLPLVNVPVPTFLFMAIAPGLGALLYSYFHLHLLKHWEALTAPDPIIDGQPLSEQIAPWLVSDFALAMRDDGALRDRPLRRVANGVNIALAFFGTPTLLAWFWWRSAAPHFEWLTIFVCGLPLIFSVFVGAVSWQRLRDLTDDPGAKSRTLAKWGKWNFAVFAVGLTALGWFRVEGTLSEYARWFGVPEETVAVAWWAGTPFPGLLYSADLAGVNFAQVPEGWLGWDEDRKAYRKTWCAAEGIPANVCGTPAADAKNPPMIRSRIRRKWCGDLPVESSETVDCGTIFADIENRFEFDWLAQWKRTVSALPRFSFKGADIRDADLNSANLQNADLSEARIQGADLRRAHMQGALLDEAQMQGALLSDAWMQGANLVGAQMQGAILILARMKGADVRYAIMRRAILEGAQMQGADLGGAQMQGADLLMVRMDAATDLTDASLRGAALRFVDYTDVSFSQAQVDEVFYDGSVKFAPDITRMGGREEQLEWPEFDRQWRAWQKSIGFGPDAPGD